MQRDARKSSTKADEPPPKRKRGTPKLKKQETGLDDVLVVDVKNLLRRHEPLREARKPGEEVPPTVLHAFRSKDFPETEVTVEELSSTGDGLALSLALDHVYVVPFTVPGDRVRIKVCKTIEEESYSETDLVEVLEPSPQRNDSLINCQYFGKCSGCQLQMMTYEDQLKHKKRVIEKAYKNFSGILPELIPPIGDTMGSPLQYGYRTKLTPHFSRPRLRKQSADKEGSPEPPAIGFVKKGRRQVLDIEDCPLGTPIVRRGLKNERERVLQNFDQFKSGATILIRESTSRKKKPEPSNGQSTDTQQRNSEDHGRTMQPADADVVQKEFLDYIEEKRYVTDPNSRSSEYVDDYLFHTQAGTFFQNNNSILSPFIAYIRENVRPPIQPESESNGAGVTKPPPNIKYLLDAYCGSGLFTITLSKLFLSSLGIDISTPGIYCARANALANDCPNAGFAAADAADLFRDVPYPPDQTLLIIDPPRKGCDMNFLNQMLAFGPTRVIYVSCNVHTQARDVGVLVEGGNGNRYEIESIRGFDFFPQTGHVESVAVLNKVTETEKKEVDKSR
ncbi:hypothetical protein VTO42DRAFT_2072 [Malbranchea cinnamomea]